MPNCIVSEAPEDAEEPEEQSFERRPSECSCTTGIYPRWRNTWALRWVGCTRLPSQPCPGVACCSCEHSIGEICPVVGAMR